MTWLIIGVILLAAFGPVLWLMPSKRDRLLSGLRQQALREGLVVELRRLPKLNPTPEERVSAGGKVREPVVECMAYTLMLTRRLQVLGGWRLLRHDDEEDLAEIPAGWAIDPAMRSARSEVALVGEWLRPLLQELPEDVIGVELSAGSVAAYWLEKAGASEATVTRLAALLGHFGEQTLALDQRQQDELNDDDS